MAEKKERELKSTMLMTGYERRIVEYRKKSAGDIKKDERMITNAMKAVLGMEVTENLETGEKVNLTLAEKLVVEKVKYDLEHPKNINLKDYASVLGETKQSVDINVGADAQELFGDIVIDAKSSEEKS